MPTLTIDKDVLFDGESEQSFCSTSYFRLERSPWRLISIKQISTHILTIMVTFFVIVRLDINISPRTKCSRDNERHPLLWSPFTAVIEHIIDRPPKDYWSNPLYFGPPGDESERAWNDILTPHGIQIYPDEEQHFEESQLRTVKHKNGNHLLIPGVYHNLHCLRKFRQLYIYKDHYYPNITEEEWIHEHAHTIHCLETIRTSMQCHPDLTLMRYYWSGRKWHDRNVGPDSIRECINWDRFHEAKKARWYDADDVMHNGLTQGEYAAKFY